MLIAFNGYAGSGKDTAAEYLASRYGFQIRSFAAKLKDLAIAANPIVNPSSDLNAPWTLQEVIRETGSLEAAKRKYPEVRGFLQRLGTAGVREHFGTDFWVDQILPIHHGWGPEKGFPSWLPGRMAISDCRFPNEADRVKLLGGVIVRIERDGVGPANNHASEVLLEAPGLITIRNKEGRIDLLRKRLDDLVELLASGEPA